MRKTNFKNQSTKTRQPGILKCRQSECETPKRHSINQTASMLFLPINQSFTDVSLPSAQNRLFILKTANPSST